MAGMQQHHLRVGSYIDGKFVERAGGMRLSIRNPWTGEALADVAGAGSDEVSLAIAAARRTFDSSDWSHLPPAERGAMLHAIANGLAARKQELATIEALNAGKPFTGAAREVEGAIRAFTYYAGAMDKYFGDTIPLGKDLLNLTLRESLGVVGQIVPWNFPLLGASWKLAPALAAGCCCVLKPSPATPLTALLLAEICAEAGIPPGVVNILPGGTEVGQQIVADPRVDGISFTGSTAVGSEIMRMAAGSIKKVALELGGKNACVIFADADLRRAAVSAAASGFGNAGQSCSARSRILVQRSVAREFLELFGAAATKLRVGAAMDPETSLGPLISEQHRSGVAASVDAAVAAGARLAAGGSAVAGAGFFFEPTILDDVLPSNPAFSHEIFGPVCSITTFDTEAEGIQLVNDSQYGLNGSVWSADIGRALRVARAMRTGMVAVNGLPSASKTSIFAPFGGYKQSGIGRELGLEALGFYTEIKNLVIDLS